MRTLFNRAPLRRLSLQKLQSVKALGDFLAWIFVCEGSIQGRVWIYLVKRDARWPGNVLQECKVES